jgi:uncharacterized protein YndB with AHSA1/START domain
MNRSSGEGRRTLATQHVRAPRETVYRAFLDAEAVAVWLAPDTMRGEVHRFEPHEGGMIRMSLTYQNPEDAIPGKSSDDTDTFTGKFVELRPNERIVQVFEFESEEPEFAGVMRMTWSLKDVDGGTEVSVLCEDIPSGIRLEDNELGSRQSLHKLAAFVEGGGV